MQYQLVMYEIATHLWGTCNDSDAEHLHKKTAQFR